MTPYPVSFAPPTRTENLALIFQEVFTAIVRLRSNRQQSPDAETFRYHMREATKAAAQEGRTRGAYNQEDVKMATLAVVALLDESVLSSRNPVFAHWARQPLGQEFFGSHEAGYVFFDNLTQLLARTDSPELADVLEVYYLCLLLGYTGRYSGEALQSKRRETAEKIARIRGDSGELSLPITAPRDVIPAAKKGGMRPLMIAAIACFVLTLVLFVAFKLSLSSGVSGLRIFAAGRV